MSQRAESFINGLRLHGPTATIGAALVLALVLGGRWVALIRTQPPPARGIAYRVVTVQPPSPSAPASQPETEQRPAPADTESPSDRARSARVDFKPWDIPSADAPRPGPPVAGGPAPGAAAAGPGGGRLGLATEAEGPGDAFNLPGKPGGRALLGPGRLSDGSVDEPEDSTGDRPRSAGGSGPAYSQSARYAWYYVRIARELEDAFRTLKPLTTAATRVELKVWADASGRISRVRLVRSTGDPRLDEAIQSVAGLRISERPPADIPMPMLARLTARRPE